MKRSNRLVLLVGVFLAIVAFIAVLLLGPGSGGGGGTPPVPTTAPTVIATADIPLGARITADKVTVQDKPIDGRDVDAFGDVSQVLGKTVREPVVSGAAITARTLQAGRSRARSSTSRSHRASARSRSRSTR